LERGRTLALVGASGSGKSTLARCLTQFETPTGGEILFEGRPLSPDRRLEIQLIFQQPAASLNPRFTAAEIVEEPLVIQRAGTARGRRERAAFALGLAGIARTALGKRAHEFSGGERQRLAIARALVAEPKVLILDESFNGLDASLVAQTAQLLNGLQRRLGVAYILISHDLTLVAGMADEIGVMERGAIVEHAPTATLMSQPRHLKTRELIDASVALEGPRT
jgi:ABC-type glutathione transport system ATPase component